KVATRKAPPPVKKAKPAPPKKAAPPKQSAPTKVAPAKIAPKKTVAAKPAPAPAAVARSDVGAKPRYYITTSIAYPNGPPHIGYGYEVICTDAIARFKRLDGYEVFFLTGTDEHGIKLWQTANKLGIPPRALVDENSARFRAMAERLNSSNDAFIRTTEE